MSAATAVTATTTRRAEARESIAQAWHERRTSRRRSSEHTDETSHPTNLTQRSHRPSNALSNSTALSPLFNLPTLCELIQKAWERVRDGDTKRQSHNRQRPKEQRSRSSSPSDKERTATGNTQRPSFSNSSSRVFPSILPILQAHVLAQQVEFLQATQAAATRQPAWHTTTADPDDNEDSQPIQDMSKNNDITNTKDEEVSLVETVLSVLPASYDWNKAVQQMIQSRSRAFWLYDLATPVRRLVHWQGQYASPKVRFLVTAQRVDAVWRRLLARMDRVGLVVHTNWEWDHCCGKDGSHPGNNHDDEENHIIATTGFTTTTNMNKAPLYDDSTRPGLRTDSFVRRVVWASSHHQQWQGWTVRGPPDVQRMYRVIHRLLQRHGQQTDTSFATMDEIPRSCLSFVLRLPLDDIDSWTWLTKATLTATQIVGGRLAGISLDWSKTDDSVVREKATYDLLHNTLSEVSHLRVDLTGVSGLDEGDPTEAWWYQILPQLDNVAEITVEATDTLLTTAGALCTRIIGVRTMPDQRRHYYIDDGCYGSLSQNADATAPPLPLCASGAERINDVVDSSNQRKDSDVDLLPSTVWGPTCDGLDRVCPDVALPSLQRDDWLVFPHVSTGGGGQGLSTAFNGFDPPDSVYCVLGYFQ